MLIAVSVASKRHLELIRAGYRSHHTDGRVVYLEPPPQAECERRGQAAENHDDTPDPDEMDELETPQCPMCKGPGMLLGQLGQLTHYRCRNCGVVFHTPRA